MPPSSPCFAVILSLLIGRCFSSVFFRLGQTAGVISNAPYDAYRCLQLPKEVHVCISLASGRGLVKPNQLNQSTYMCHLSAAGTPVVTYPGVHQYSDPAAPIQAPSRPGNRGHSRHGGDHRCKMTGQQGLSLEPGSSTGGRYGV